MSRPENPNEFDEFQDLFADLNSLPQSRPELAESIFLRTRGVLSRRRWFRRGRLIAALVACYAFGICSGWVLKPGAVPHMALHQPEQKSDESIAVVESPRAVVNPSVPKPARNQGDVRASLTPKPAKIFATESKDAVARAAISPFESLRRAGDRKLFERGDIRGAMDCYRRALIHATDHDLQVEIDRDSWLLMSLKQSRIEERKHVRQKRV